MTADAVSALRAIYQDADTNKFQEAFEKLLSLAQVGLVSPAETNVVKSALVEIIRLRGLYDQQLHWKPTITGAFRHISARVDSDETNGLTSGQFWTPVGHSYATGAKREARDTRIR